MDLPMRRTALLTAAFAVGLLSLGCRHSHIAGKCDCTNDPANHHLPAAGNPYTITGSSVSGPGVAVPAEKAPAPMSLPQVK
jgi:hypothetical protein